MAEYTTATRRQFFRCAAATLTAPFIIPARSFAVDGSQRPSPGNRITMALIGCGGMGNSNLYAFLRKPDVQVLAVCDPDRERLESTRAAVNEYYAENSTSGSYAGCDGYNDFRSKRITCGATR